MDGIRNSVSTGNLSSAGQKSLESDNLEADKETRMWIQRPFWNVLSSRTGFAQELGVDLVR